MLVIAGLALSTVLLINYLVGNPNQTDLKPPITNTAASSIQEQASYGLPVRLKIPVANVDSAIEQVGLTSDGAMDTPRNQENAAWYTLGQRPGENGSAVIAGHYGVWDNGRGSVFDNLHKLRKGDTLYIKDDKGTTITFVVRESRNYNPEADATDVFVSNDGKSHLNLVTCEGVWNNVIKSYSERLVVFTDKE